MNNRLQIIFGADASEFQRTSRSVGRELDVIGRSAGQLRGALAGIFAGASLGGFAAFTKETLAYADAIDKAADKIGIGTEALQELRQAAASASGIAEGQLDVAMQRFSRRVGEAAQGTGDLVKVLDQYGIKVRDTAGVMRPLENILGDYADAIQGAESEQEKLRLAFKGFDSEGAALVNTLRNGARGLDDLRQAARDAGTVLEDSAIRSAAALNDKWDTAVKSAQTTFRSFVLDVVDGWSQIAERFKYGLDLGASGVSLSVEVTDLNAQLITAQNELDRLLNARGAGGRSRQAISELRAEIEQLERRRDAAVQQQFRLRNPADSSPATLPSGAMAKAGKLNAEFSANLQALIADASSKGLQIGIKEGFRSAEEQAVLWQRALKKYGSAEAARKWVAPPGKSYHQKGMAADLSYGSDAARQYAQQNAGRFGLNFPLGNEAWHVELAGARGKASTSAAKRQVVDPAAAQAARELNAALAEGKRIIEDTRTPLEAYVAQQERLVALQQAGAFSTDIDTTGIETFGRASRAAFDDYVAGVEAAKGSTDELKEGITGMQQASYDFGQTFTSALEEAIISGANFKDILSGIVKDIARMVLRLAVTNQIMNAITGYATGTPGTLPTFANGGRINAGVNAGIYSSPVFFPMANPRRFATGGIGVLGEAGPEAVVPLPDGKTIPVDLKGQTGANVEINIIESPGSGGQTRERTGDGGQRVIDVMVEQVRAKLSGDIASGGQFAGVFERQYGLNRAVGGY